MANGFSALPDHWDYLVHFTGRARKKSNAVPWTIRNQTARRRFDQILDEGAIRAFRPYGGGTPVVSFTEAVQSSLEHLIDAEQFEPWGLVFAKSTVYAEGGGPVWYVRDDLRQQVPPALRGWAVRTTDPSVSGRGTSRWTHEREWRVPGTGNPLQFGFGLASLHAVIAPQSQFRSVDVGLDRDVQLLNARLEHLGRRHLRHTETPRVWMWNSSRKRLWDFRRFGDNGGGLADR